MKKEKKREKKKKIRIKEKKKIRKTELFRRKAAVQPAVMDESCDGDAFDVKVRPSEPILRLKEDKKQTAVMAGLVPDLACAAMVVTAIALFCMCVHETLLIPFAVPGAVIFMAIAALGTLKPGAFKWIAAAAAAVLLLLTAVIWRDQIIGGLSTLINEFYDAAEAAQAYIYNRIGGEYEASTAACRAGIAWISCLIGLIAALPPARIRRTICGLAAIAIMIAFAYYGLIPSAVCIAVLIAALIAAVSRGGSLSFLPVTLIALLIFGAIVLADPGENYSISRVDENLRDRFALSSVLIETDDSSYDEEEEDYDPEEEDSEDEDEFEEKSDYSTYVIYGSLILVAAAMGAGAFLLFRRISKKRAANRSGLDSKDNKEAVTAMFPYAVRWLKGYGIEQTEPSFTSMSPEIGGTFSEEYARRFNDMYVIWSDAAYSDHEVSETSRELMDKFMKDTVKMVDDKCRFMDKLRLKFKYAL